MVPFGKVSCIRLYNITVNWKLFKLSNLVYAIRFSHNLFVILIGF